MASQYHWQVTGKYLLPRMYSDAVTWTRVAVTADESAGGCGL